MIFAALSEAADRGELLLVQNGLCRFHLRRDGVVVIREVLVLVWARRQGVGRALIAEVRSRHPNAPLEAHCPLRYESNAFWKALGFRKLWTTSADSVEKRVNVWRLDPA